MAEPIHDDEGGSVLTPDREKEKQAVKPPPLYAVIVLNDDFTTMDHVVDILMTHFGHDEASAEKIMMDVHQKGKGIAGIYPKDIAETKALRVNTESQDKGHPLLLQVEPQEE